MLEIARRHGIRNVAIHTAETVAQRDYAVEADKIRIYYDNIAKAFGFKKRTLDVGGLKGDFWVRTAGAKVAKKDDTTSLTFSAGEEGFPPVVLVRWERGTRWRTVLKAVKAIAGEIAGHRVPWREPKTYKGPGDPNISIFNTLWNSHDEQQAGWEEYRGRGRQVMYDVAKDGSFVSVGRPAARQAEAAGRPTRSAARGTRRSPGTPSACSG